MNDILFSYSYFKIGDGHDLELCQGEEGVQGQGRHLKQSWAYWGNEKRAEGVLHVFYL